MTKNESQDLKLFNYKSTEVRKLSQSIDTEKM